jgi:hypothetical protein
MPSRFTKRNIRSWRRSFDWTRSPLRNTRWRGLGRAEGDVRTRGPPRPNKFHGMSYLIEVFRTDTASAQGSDQGWWPKVRGADVTMVRVPRVTRRTTVLIPWRRSLWERSRRPFCRLHPRERTRFRRLATRFGASANNEPLAVIIVAHKLVRRIYALLRQRAAVQAGAAEAPMYRLQRPDGTALTTSEARTWVAEQYPTKRSKAMHPKGTAGDVRRTRSVPQEGSSEDATKPSRLPPPDSLVPESAHLEKSPAPNDKLVSIAKSEQGPFLLAAP